MNYYWPILLIVGSNVCYHLAAKSLPAAINPLASLGVTYVVAATISIALYFITSPVKNLATEYTGLNWTSFVMGTAIVGLEFGYISMYKAGWNLSIGSLVANISLAVVLIIIGVLLYKDTITTRQLLGVALCIGGLVLINK